MFIKKKEKKRNGRTESQRGDTICPQWWQMVRPCLGPLQREEGVCAHPEWPQGSSPAFKEVGKAGSGKSPGREVFLRLALWRLAVTVTTGTHRLGDGLEDHPCEGLGGSSCA